MCGIAGYTGPAEAGKIVLDALARLEYRGYDSAGVALVMGDRSIRIEKTTAKVASLRERLRECPAAEAAIGHTRWATHGEVSLRNAHPHCWGRVTLVHNGVVENCAALKREMAQNGRFPASETDTEIAAMVIDFQYDADPVLALRSAMEKIRGASAFAALFADRPGEVYAVTRGAPLVAAHTRMGSFLASDAVALAKCGGEMAAVPDDTVLCLTPEGIRAYDPSGKPATLTYRRAPWRADEAERDGYEHYMLKEIHQQPAALLREIDFTGIPADLTKGCANIRIVACGSAMHAALAAREALEEAAGLPVSVEIASEYVSGVVRTVGQTLFILVSQSGETADTLLAMKRAKSMGARTLAVVNVADSALDRGCDYALRTLAGPEIAVASTKAFVAQVAALGCLANHFAGRAQPAPEALSRLAADALDRVGGIRAVGERLARADSIFYLGSGADFALAREGALKLKEISYIHAEACPTGELKHGCLSLVSPGMPCVLMAMRPENLVRSLISAREVRARGGEVILVTYDSAPLEADCADTVLRLPDARGVWASIPAAVCVQLLAYYCALKMGRDIDQPRNLAKSVTVI